MKSWLKFALIGAGAFWLPDLLLHALRRNSFSGFDVLALTLVLPVTFSFGFVWARRSQSALTASRLALYMLSGVWILGGPMMVAAATFSGGWFLASGSISGKIGYAVLSIIPVMTYIMATYDGSLFALVAVTLVWIVFAAVKADPRFTRSRF